MPSHEDATDFRLRALEAGYKAQGEKLDKLLELMTDVRLTMAKSPTACPGTCNVIKVAVDAHTASITDFGSRLSKLEAASIQGKAFFKGASWAVGLLWAGLGAALLALVKWLISGNHP